MKLIPVNCPRCNSRQRFAPQRRVLESGVIEKYVRCKMCRTEIIIDQGKPRRRRRGSLPAIG